MPTLDDIAPMLSSDVVLHPLKEDGRHVVKIGRKQRYLQLGEQESFLLLKFDGKTPYREITTSFEDRFQEPLSADDVGDFVKMAKDEGLLERSGRRGSKDATEVPQRLTLFGVVGEMVKQARKQSPLYFRVALYNPNAFLNWLEPRTRWLFSRQLAVAAAVGTVLALVITWGNRQELAAQFFSQLSWRTLAVAWITSIAVTICHEFGHGLACKRYGGEVREMGALWIFLTPCLFCNVSDAWLLSCRWRRLLISMAGTYVDLLIWIIAVFFWRVTAPTTFVNFAAWIIVTTCGLRVAFNINPLMRLDGYYALSDLLEIPNLRRRARARWMEFVRWILWGAERPAPIPQGRVLIIYGVTSWFFTVSLLNLLFLKVTVILQSTLGIAGFIGGATLFVNLSKRYFKGSLGGEFQEMFRTRRNRLIMWGAAAAAILVLPVHDRAGGPFHVRPVRRWEVRAPIDAFLREVAVDEGDYVEAGDVLARLEVPELVSELARKEAEIHEVEALLRRLTVGPRAEELAEQRERLARAAIWRDLASQDLKRATAGYHEELAGLEQRISQGQSELEYRQAVFQQAKQLYEKGGLAGQQLLSEKKQLQFFEAELFQAQSAKRAREAEGLMKYEGELARREKEMADTQAALTLLEAGSRTEDIEAEQARLRRLGEERKHLVSKQAKQVIVAPASGTITTQRLAEKIGQFLPRGAEVCFIEDMANLEAEVAVPEKDSRVLQPGQTVTLKPRSLPFCRLDAKVDRIAPSAFGKPDPTGQLQSMTRTVTVYCRLENAEGDLRTGMTGFGRVYHNWRPLGWICVTRSLQFLRTEFWL